MITLDFVMQKEDIVSFSDIRDILYNHLYNNIELLMHFVELQGGEHRVLRKLELVDEGRIPLEDVVKYITPTCTEREYEAFCDKEDEFCLPCEFDDEGFMMEL